MLNVIIKFCKRCNSETDRYKSGRCVPCRAARYSENQERIKAASAVWYAGNSDHAKAVAALWRKANLEKIKSSGAAYRKANLEARRIDAHNRRARKLTNGGKLSKGLSAKLFKLQKGKCPCCNQPLGDDYHMDHIMPLKSGGANEDWNIQLLRQQCNNQKSAKDPIEFMQSRGKLL